MTGIEDGRLLRVDRRGYSGSVHAARYDEGELRTLCGKRTASVQWRVSFSAFDAAQVECKGCLKALRASSVAGADTP